MHSEPDENAPEETNDATSSDDDRREAAEAEAAVPAAEVDSPSEPEATTDLAPVVEGPGAQVDRLTDVLLAADQAAAEILDAARAEASEFVAETQRSTVERAESLRQETDNLMAQTAELTAKVVELTRATEQVMEGFRAELSLDAPEVREETMTPALPEVSPTGRTDAPAEAAARIEDVAPEDTSVAPAPVTEDPDVDDAAPSDETSVTSEESAILDDDLRTDDVVSDGGQGPPVEPSPAETSAAAGPPPSPAPTTESVTPVAEPKRRGLFGRFRGRGKEPAETATPTPTAASGSTEETPAIDTPSGPVTEGARLIARQMLATGLGEEEVKRQLREQFRLADPQAVLDSLRRNDRGDQGG